MSAKYVTLENGDTRKIGADVLLATSSSCAAKEQKESENLCKVHIYENYRPGVIVETSDEDDESERVQINRCVPKMSGSTLMGEPALDEDNEFFGGSEFNIGYAQFLLRNRKQLTSISGGVVLLFPASLHVIWALTKFAWLEKDERTMEVFAIFSSWYIGAIAGNLLGGLLVPLWPKRPIYTLGATLVIISALFMLNDASWMIVCGRALAGVSHGIVYVAVMVHASENAVKEFREILILLIGGSINFSYVLAALVFQPIDRVFLSESFIFIGSIVYAFLGLFLVLLCCVESVPFLVRNFCAESEAMRLLAELQQKSLNHRTIRHDYLMIRKMCDDELMIYGKTSFKRLFAKGNFRPIIFCTYSRLIAVLALNLPMVTFILKFLRDCIEDLMPVTGEAAAVTRRNVSTAAIPTLASVLDVLESSFLVGLYNHEIQLVVTAWCAFGISTIIALYLFDKKRLLFFTCCGLSAVLMLCDFARALNASFTTMMHLCLIAFFNYTTFALDLYGHGFLAEAFPCVLKPVSIAYVVSIEHFMHIFLILVYMVTWYHDRILVSMILIGALAYEIARKMPHTNDMSLTEAMKEYGKIDVRFVDSVVENYALRMV